MTRLFIVAALTAGGVVGGNEAIADPSVFYSTMGPVEVQQEKDGPVKKCELSIPLVSVPEFVGFRIQVLADPILVIRDFTVDVGQFKNISNGIPYDPERKPITSARVLANTFDSDKVSTRVDMKDGGMGYRLNSDVNFSALLNLVKRGDYYLMFKRTDKPDMTTYVVREKVDPKLFQQFSACVASMGNQRLQ